MQVPHCLPKDLPVIFAKDPALLDGVTLVHSVSTGDTKVVQLANLGRLSYVVNPTTSLGTVEMTEILEQVDYAALTEEPTRLPIGWGPH